MYTLQAIAPDAPELGWRTVTAVYEDEVGLCAHWTNDTHGYEDVEAAKEDATALGHACDMQTRVVDAQGAVIFTA